MMGTVRALRCLMAAAQVNLTDSRFVFNDDQLLFSTLFVYASSSNTSMQLIALDYRHRVFAPLWDIAQFPTMNFKPDDWVPSQTGKGVFTNKLTGGTPSVFHANGNQPRSFLDQTLVPLILQKTQQRYMLASPAAMKVTSNGMHRQSVKLPAAVAWSAIGFVALLSVCGIYVAVAREERLRLDCKRSA